MRGVREVEAVHGAQLDAQRTDEALGVRLAEAERRLEHEDIVVRTVDGGEDVMHVLKLTAQPACLPRYPRVIQLTMAIRYDLLTLATVTMCLLAVAMLTMATLIIARLPRRGCSALALEHEVDPQKEAAAAHVADQRA